MARIFISYARHDASTTAHELANRLRAQGHTIFLDIDNIPPGGNWREILEKSVDDCDLLVVLVTPATLKSDWVYAEVQHADKSHKTVVPVQVNEAELPVYLRGKQAIKLQEDPYDSVVLHIEKALAPRRKLRLPLLPMAAALIVGLLLGTVAGATLLPRSSCSLKRLHTPISPPQAPGTILFPENCSTDVLAKNPVDVSGTYGAGSADQAVWVLVYTNGEYWPQVMCRDMGAVAMDKHTDNWHATVWLGKAGEQYDLVLVSALPNGEADTRFKDWASEGCKTNDYPGIPAAKLPPGLTELDSVTVLAQ